MISPEELAKHYSAFRVSERLLLTGHSHQAWPDVGREGVMEAWDDAARLTDDKWERAFEKAARVRIGFRSLLREPGAEPGTFGRATYTRPCDPEHLVSERDAQVQRPDESVATLGQERDERCTGILRARQRLQHRERGAGNPRLGDLGLEARPVKARPMRQRAICPDLGGIRPGEPVPTARVQLAPGDQVRLPTRVE